jgi:hypothetical protein
MKAKFILFVTALIVILAAGSFPQEVSAVTNCDQAQFIMDVTIPDGTTLAPDSAFVKTWRLKNIGSCTWNTSYSLVYVRGEKLGAQTTLNLPASVAPGATIDISVNMTTPSQSGAYRGYWMLRNANGILFGLGSTASKPFWVDIKVSASSTPVPPTPIPTTCDKAQFITDVNVPDGTVFNPETSFTKTWRLKNVGTCTWTTAYSIVFSKGESMGATTASMPRSVAPGESVDISVVLTAPSSSGHYRGYWKLRNGAGTQFGIGTFGTAAFWVDIYTSAVTGEIVYDFYTQACSATWTSGAGTLPCPGTDGSASGFVMKLESPWLENGTTSQPGLLTHPQLLSGGYIQGVYPAFQVKKGDRFQALVNCEYRATNCYVTFQLDYQIGTGPVKTLWVFREKYEGLYYRMDLGLDTLAGQNVKFILSTFGGTYTSVDRALWVAPRITRP